MAMKKYTIVFTGLQNWNLQIEGNAKNLALEFSKTHNVLYVNTPIRRFEKIKNMMKLKRSYTGIQQINENLHVFTPNTVFDSINRITSNSIFDGLNFINNVRYANEIKKTLKSLAIKNFIQIADNDIINSFYLKDLLKPEKYVYYLRDNLSFVDYWKAHGTRLEPMHIHKSDLVLSNSVQLNEYAEKYNSNSYFIGQGCDVSLYSKEILEPIPADLPKGKPIVGYFGALSSMRLDLEAIQDVAKKHSDWNIVLIGPEDGEFKASKLHSMQNVHFLGLKRVHELPTYLKYFDVAINPQKLNEVTDGNYPRKIDEYLAMGKPVVATHTKAMNMFQRFVYLVNRKEQFANAIEVALKEDSEQRQKQRKEYALTHSWEENTKAILEKVG